MGLILTVVRGWVVRPLGRGIRHSRLSETAKLAYYSPVERRTSNNWELTPGSEHIYLLER